VGGVVVVMTGSRVCGRGAATAAAVEQRATAVRLVTHTHEREGEGESEGERPPIYQLPHAPPAPAPRTHTVHYKNFSPRATAPHHHDHHGKHSAEKKPLAARAATNDALARAARRGVETYVECGRASEEAKRERGGGRRHRPGTTRPAEVLRAARREKNDCACSRIEHEQGEAAPRRPCGLIWPDPQRRPRPSCARRRPRFSHDAPLAAGWRPSPAAISAVGGAL